MWQEGTKVGVVPSLVVVLAILVPSCPGLSDPVDGEQVRSFAPIGAYGGHWGIDFATPPGTAVHPADRGVVTFAGPVADVLSVTVDHGGGLRTSYSYLASIDVAVGRYVNRSIGLGRSGVDHELAALHFSVRIGDTYQNPANWLGCFESPHRGLALVPVRR